MNAEVYAPAAQLRFVNRETPAFKAANGETISNRARVLQQAWVALRSGAVDWRDVPLEAE